MARTAESSEPRSPAARAASADCPREATASTARAAPARALAPEAGSRLTKALALERPAVGKVPHRDRPASSSLDLVDGKKSISA